MKQPQCFLHMDEEYMWRWYIVDAQGIPIAMSARVFFDYEDALRNFRAAPWHPE